jgi:hypothetical protein
MKTNPQRRGEIPSGRTIGQAVSDARNRELEARIVKLEQRRLKPEHERTRFIRRMKKRGMDGLAICRALDAQSRKELQPLDRWIKATDIRLWADLWKCDNPKIRNCVHTCINSVQ